MVGAQMQARGASVRQVARQLGVTEGALKVVRVILPAGHQSTKVLKAGKQPFDFPAASAATQRSAILRLCASFPRCGAINSMLRSWRSLASRVSSTSVTSCGEALAILIPIGRPWPSRDCHDLRGPCRAWCFRPWSPLLAPAKVPSMKDSVGSMPPRSWRSRAIACSTLSSVPSRTHD
jgi:hypothetical protein